MKRRTFIGGVLGAAAVTGLYTWRIEPYWLDIVKVRMPLKRLPDHLVGKTLMQISDIHVGNRFDYQFLIDSFQMANDLKPDYVVYTGDFISYDGPEQLDQLREVMSYAVRGRIMSFAILGNHDYGEDWAEPEVADAVTDILRKSGVHTLRNELYDIQGLEVIGLDDYWGSNFDPQAVLASRDPRKPQIVLSHNPDVADLDVWSGYDSWILSGHTHGGQVKPPFLPPPILPVKNTDYSAGQYDLEDGRTIYINRALGSLWAMRFNVRPEITIFELEKT